jgi:hypothetical protein
LNILSFRHNDRRVIRKFPIILLGRKNSWFKGTERAKGLSGEVAQLGHQDMHMVIGKAHLASQAFD